ncbi:MAG: ABC transporter substrate-binding protein [Acidobacteria bacterium]|nr:ABC transporter substrate-binding protein [Acidobacteriota bacterium]
MRQLSIRCTLALALVAGSLATLGASASSRAAEPLTKVRFAYDFPWPDMALIPVIVAQKEGYFKEQGLKVSIVFPPSTSTTVQMLTTKSADVGLLTTSDVPVAVSAGAPIVSIANYSMRNNWGLFAKNGSGLSLASLKGKKVFSWGDTWTNAMMPFVLKKAGLKAKDVTMVTGDADTPMLLSGAVDFLTNTTNYAIPGIVGETGKKPVAITGKKAGVPDVPVWVYGVARPYAKKHQETLIKFLTALHHATMWAMEKKNQPRAVRYFDTAYPDSGYSHAYNVRAWKLTVPLLADKTGDLFMQTKKQWREMATALYGIGQISKIERPDTYFTNNYLP